MSNQTAAVLIVAMERRPDRTLIAYSEGADRFWASLGWESFEHPAGGYRTLFVQSPGGLRSAP
ncbi:hypothetical protein BEL07_24200 [Mycolicibacterium grossiae]|uniref:Uncharacterized protein n=1 Tax=Mycolicibacterium grossiae TaxID=1552759 RepID=A0A1E8PY99_9MYCO|nr:hypothetical protein [Mycolicibacterium grossiae]OFJ51171.1 hypothetical protein BEL07_24200 [Mycolicibacterium grossiae]